MRKLTGHLDRVTAAAISPDGLWAVSCSRDGSIKDNAQARNLKVAALFNETSPRLGELLELMRTKSGGESVDATRYDARVRGAVADVVTKQAESGVDVVSDGEQSKVGFFQYVRDRLSGFEVAPP